MTNESIFLFMPGRLCLIGEHSDWTSTYKKINNSLVNGRAIVVKLEEGIYGKCSKSSNIEFKYLGQDSVCCKCDINEIDMIIEKDSFWKYAFSAVKYMCNTYKNVGGINIDITKVTLPMKKGLGSSAAIILLVVHAYNLLYNLHLSCEDEMNIAFLSEISIGSKCGRLDQIGVLENQISLLEFGKDNKVKFSNINIKNDIYLVYADLMSTKDTVMILDDLNSCYPFYNNDIEKNVHNFLGERNQKIVNDVKKAIEDGDIATIGKLLSSYQKEFDMSLIPVCESLKAPLLHKVLKDKNVRKLSIGGKGCGSGGDGSVQFIVESKDKQQRLIKYLKEKLNIDAYSLTIKSNKIKKAIIPVGGFGTRMYPMSKIIDKELLPLIDGNGNIKPAILYLLKELIDAGIEQIGLILPKSYQKMYVKLFENNENYKMFFEDEKKLKNIASKICFIDDEFQSGVCNAIKLAKKFIGEDDFMFVLGDQIYKSYTNKSCIKQILDFYYSKNTSVISVCDTKFDDLFKYGIVTGKKVINNKYFKILNFTEKPSNPNSYTNLLTGNKYYSIFGCYIFKNKFLDMLCEYDVFTDALSQYVLQQEMMAFIPDGRYFDIGNNISYYESFIQFGKDR